MKLLAGALRVIGGLALGALLFSACATGGAMVAEGTRPRLALLPLENLSSRPESGEITGRLILTALNQKGRFEVVEPGEVEEALSEFGIRFTGSLSTEQLQKIAGRVNAPYVMIGSVLESGRVRTPYAEVPSTGLALRVLEAATARVIWADMKFRTGADGETVFGWGRQTNEEKLTADLVRDMLGGLKLPRPAPAAADEGDRP